VDLGQRQAARVNFCTTVAAVMAVLEEMAGKELRQEPFTQEKPISSAPDEPAGSRVCRPSFDGGIRAFLQEFSFTTDRDGNGCNKPIRWSPMYSRRHRID